MCRSGSFGARNWISGILVLAVVLGASRAALCAGPPIDWIDLNTFGHYSQTYSPTGTGLMVIGEADWYHLHDGSSWDSGAGSVGNYFTKKVSTSTSGAEIEYALDRPVGSLVFFRIDYNAGDHSSYGQLVSSAPLVLRASNGSKTARLTGYALLTVNEPANYTDDRFSYFNAPIGSLVPFDVTYTLTGSQTWSPTTMDGTFSYNLAGKLDFREAIVPEPWAQFSIPAAALVLLPLARRRV